MSLYDLDTGMGAARESDRKPLRYGESTLATVVGIHQDKKHIFVRLGTGGAEVPLSPGSVLPPVGQDVLLVATRTGLVAVYFPAAAELAWNYIMPVGGTQVQPDVLLGVRCRITGWQLEADVAGDVVVEIRRGSRTGSAVTGTGTQRPALSGAAGPVEGTVGSEWTPLIELWDRLYFVVISSSGIAKLSIALKAVRV